MRLRRDDPIEVKSPAQLAIMREAGLVTAAALRAVADAVEPGISTAELDAIAEREIRAAGAVPSFKGYFGFPATICTSVNEQIVHGIPSRGAGAARRRRAVNRLRCHREGLARRLGADRARRATAGTEAGQAAPVASGTGRAGHACELALWRGLAQAVPGRRLTDISHAVEQAARAAGRYGIIREYTGHGIGTPDAHGPPGAELRPAGPRPGAPCRAWRWRSSPCWCSAARRPGVLADDWTVVTAGWQLGCSLRAHRRGHRGRPGRADGRGRRAWLASPRCGRAPRLRRLSRSGPAGWPQRQGVGDGL